jgi:hypothetical protein
MFTRFSLIAVIVLSGFFCEGAIAAFVPDYNPPPQGQPHGTGTR